MYQGSDIINKPIITRDMGEKIGSVKDVLFNSKHRVVQGLVVNEGGFMASPRIVPFSAIATVGTHAVIVPSRDAIRPATKESGMDQSIREGTVVKGTHVMTEDGKDLGKIADIFFDEKTGAIEGYQVSGGIFADAYTGKSFLPAPDSFRLGKDAAFIPNETADLMEEQIGGIKGAAMRASTKGKAKAKDVTRGASDAAEKSRSKLAGTTSELHAHAEAGMEALRGRRIQKTVRTKTGSIVAAAGQIVDGSILDRARVDQVEDELLNAVGDTKKRARDFSESTQARTKESARQAWTSAKGTASELRDKAISLFEQKRIERAIGKRTNRVVLDVNDTMILDEGERITHESIRRARDAGVLSVLLSSAETPRARSIEKHSETGREHVGRAKDDYKDIKE
jgi:uncharacterized protein YrrD